MTAISIAHLVFVGVATLVAISDWRKGLLLIIVVAVLQDPVRKLTPGAPSWFVLSVMPVFGGILLGVMSDREWWAEAFARNESRLTGVMQIFAIWLLVALAVGVIRHGFDGIVLGILGFLTYGVGILAILIGFNGGLEAKLVRRICMWFCVLTSLSMVGVVMEVSGAFAGWDALGTRVLDMKWIRHVPGRIIEMRSGFYRSPDVLGWHSTLATMLALALSFSSRSPTAKLFWLMVAAWTLVGTYYCGRRKFFYTLPIFMIALFWCKRRRAGDLGLQVVGLAVAAVVFVMVILPRMGGDDDIGFYYFSTLGDTFERVKTSGYNSVMNTFREQGIFGGGLGSVSTGAHRAGFAGSNKIGWQESGASRIAMELGLPGMIIAIWLFWVVLVRSGRAATDFGTSPRTEDHLYVGVFAATLANFASFFISHQVFGDPFVGFFTALLIGVLLGGHVPLVARYSRAMAPRGSESAAVVPAGPAPGGGVAGAGALSYEGRTDFRP